MYVCRQPLAPVGTSALLLGFLLHHDKNWQMSRKHQEDIPLFQNPVFPLLPTPTLGPQICPKSFVPLDFRDPSAVKLLGGALPQKEQLQEWDPPTGRPPISKLFSSLSQTLA